MRAISLPSTEVSQTDSFVWFANLLALLNQNILAQAEYVRELAAGEDYKTVLSTDHEVITARSATDARAQDCVANGGVYYPSWKHLLSAQRAPHAECFQSVCVVEPMDVGPCHHGMAVPRVADGGTASYMEGSCE
jgi:hypothetical protein